MGTPISAVLYDTVHVSGGVSVDEYGSLLCMPTAATNERFPFRVKWDNPSSGNSMWPLYIEPLSSEDLGVSTPGHGAFGIQLELTDFGGYYDCIYNIGMHGDGITTVKNLQVWETGYDISFGQGLLSNERYDVVHHPNATHWPIRRRMGWGYSTYDTNQGTVTGGVSFGFADMDQIDFRSSYANPDNPSIGEFGTYHSIYPNYQTGGLSVAWLGRQGVVQLDIQSAGTFISSTRRVSITVPASDPTNAAPYTVIIGSWDTFLLYNSLAYFRFPSNDSYKEILLQNPDDTDRTLGQIRVTSPGGAIARFGVVPQSFSFENIKPKQTFVKGSHGVLIDAVSGGIEFQCTSATVGGFYSSGDYYIRPNASVTPATIGDMTFEATSDTQLKIKYKGSDGTVRSATLTLS